MEIKTFAVERWMNTYENDAVYRSCGNRCQALHLR